MEEAKVLRGDEEILNAYKAYGAGTSSNFLAFYHGGLNAIIMDPKLMLIHFFDRQVHRGYAVFDTCNMFNRKIYLFETYTGNTNDLFTVYFTYSDLTLGYQFTNSVISTKGYHLFFGFKSMNMAVAGCKYIITHVPFPLRDA